MSKFFILLTIAISFFSACSSKKQVKKTPTIEMKVSLIKTTLIPSFNILGFNTPSVKGPTEIWGEFTIKGTIQKLRIGDVPEKKLGNGEFSMSLKGSLWIDQNENMVKDPGEKDFILKIKGGAFYFKI